MLVSFFKINKQSLEETKSFLAYSYSRVECECEYSNNNITLKSKGMNNDGYVVIYAF